MRVGDVLFFSPRFRFADLDFDDQAKLVEAFRDRAFGFYLTPAFKLLQQRDAFAGGLVCCSAIDFLAKYAIGGGVGYRIIEFLRTAYLGSTLRMKRMSQELLRKDSISTFETGLSTKAVSRTSVSLN